MRLHNQPEFNKKGIPMAINWIETKAQQFLPVQDAELDELSISFDFALSAEIIDLLYAKNTASQQAKSAKAASITRVALDEHEQALA
jgi:hypothetical protein